MPDTNVGFYLVMAKDDDTIPQKRYEELIESLNRNHIKTEIQHVPTGSHGYGLGVGTDSEGWVDRALEFTKTAEFSS